MPNIPINPLVIAGAVNYSIPANAQPTTVCKPAVQGEGVRTRSLQFSFDKTLCWYVDPKALGQSPNAGMSKLSSLWVDAHQFLQGIFIYFPDSGYTDFIDTGTSKLIPILSNQNLPPFYVIVAVNIPGANFDSRSLVPLPYVVNIILCNTLLPPFSSNDYIRAQDYFYSDFFVPEPAFTATTNYSKQTTITNTSGNNSTTVLNANFWFYTGSDVSLVGSTTDGSTAIVTATWNDNATPFLTKYFILTPNIQFFQIFDDDQLNYQSSNTGNLTFNLNCASPITASVAINPYVGILKL